MGFSDWSTRLTDYFFGPHQDQRRVRLMVNREVLDGEFSYLGGTEQFLEDMRNGPDWNNINSSFTTIRDRALYLWDIWKEPHLRGDQYPDVGSHGQDGPPFLPYLCLLCITWTEAGDDDSVRAGHNFHGRFETIYPDQNLRQHIAKLLPLWQGLQKWTERNDAKFGRFVVEQLGGQIHVGIPKSQVILTTHKIERLSELFHLSMLPLGGAASKEEIRIAIERHGSCAKSILGKGVYDEIIDHSPLGSSALQVISECLEDWDGLYSTEEGAIVVGTRIKSIKLLVLLQKIDDSAGWKMQLGIQDNDDLADKIEFQGDYKLVRVETGLHVLTWQRDDQAVDASIREIREGIIAHDIDCMISDPDEATSQRATLILASTRAWFFGWSKGDRLIETAGLFQGLNNCYILLPPEREGKLWTWVDRYHDESHVEPFTTAGLPRDWQLFCIKELHKVSPEGVDAFPWGDNSNASGFKPVQLIGGSSFRYGGTSLSYLPYDPPDLQITTHGHVSINTSGASITQITSEGDVHEVSGYSSRLYSFDINEKTSQVEAVVLQDGAEIGRVSFPVFREQFKASSGELNGIQLNPCGFPVASGGAKGSVVPRNNQDPDAGGHVVWEFKEDLICPLRDESYFDLSLFKSYRLLEALTLSSRKWNVREFRRRVERICSYYSRWIARDIQLLRDLGYIEVELDSRGRMAYLHPNPLSVYALPLRENGKYRFVLSGCARVSEVKDAIGQLKDRGMRVGICSTNDEIIPPRICISCDHLHEIVPLAAQLNIPVVESPPASSLSHFSAGIDTWFSETSTQFNMGYGPEPEGIYDPYLFRLKTTDREEMRAPYRLQFIEDPQTRAHKSFVIVKQDAENYTGAETHRFVRDPSWGKWEVQNRFVEWGEKETTPVPYCNRTQSLIIPAGLSFPCLLSRALSFCSGLPPLVINEFEPFFEKHPLVPPEAGQYFGTCKVFREIPEAIARVVLSRLKAEPTVAAYFTTEDYLKLHQ